MNRVDEWKMSIFKLSSLRALMQRSVPPMAADVRGAAAVEFAMIVPLMITVFFGTAELSSAVAVDRKLEITARTLSDLVSQAATVTNSDVTNIFAAAAAVLTPYTSTPFKAKISSVNIDVSGNAKIGWSFASNDTPHAANEVVTVPSGLIIPGTATQLIWSEVKYQYTPLAGWVLKSGVALKDQFYTRARQSSCVQYNSAC
jgi:Flp pilus assembly protein TadG